LSTVSRYLAERQSIGPVEAG